MFVLSVLKVYIMNDRFKSIDVVVLVVGSQILLEISIPIPIIAMPSIFNHIFIYIYIYMHPHIHPYTVRPEK